MKPLAVLLSLLLLPVLTQGAEKRVRANIRVSVHVSSKSNEDQIKSYLSRELRQLDDVIVTDENPLFTISCVAVPIGEQGRPLGWALSVTIESMLNVNVATMALPVAQRVPVLRFLPEGVLVEHLLRTCGANNLQATCKEMVAGFDGKAFESARQFAQSYFDNRDSENADPTQKEFTGFTLAEVEDDKPQRGDLLAAKTQPAPAAPADPPVTSATSSALPEPPLLYKVTGISAGDSLVVRSGPGVANAAVWNLPPNFVGVQPTGRVELNQKTEWAEIRIGEGKSGWVRSKYIAPSH